MEGVMMRGTDVWGAAVRRLDGQIAVIRQDIWDLTHKHRWAKWPFIRGNIALLDTLNLGLRSLFFSFNVLVEEQMEQERKAQAEAATAEEQAPDDGKAAKRKKAPKEQSDMGWAVWLAMVPSLALGLGPELGAVVRLGPVALNPVARWSSFIGELPADNWRIGVRGTVTVHPGLTVGFDLSRQETWDWQSTTGGLRVLAYF